MLDTSCTFSGSSANSRGCSTRPFTGCGATRQPSLRRDDRRTVGYWQKVTISLANFGFVANHQLVGDSLAPTSIRREKDSHARGLGFADIARKAVLSKSYY